MVAHTPALPHHAQIRAQKSAQFSMVSTVYTLSMGTYWVWRGASRTKQLPRRKVGGGARRGAFPHRGDPYDGCKKWSSLEAGVKLFRVRRWHGILKGS